MARISLSRRQFHQRAQKGNLIPVFQEMLGDTLTPISIFQKLGGEQATNAFLLESVLNGEDLGRHSFIGVQARAVLRGSLGRFQLLPLEGGTTTRPTEFQGDPLVFLESQFQELKPVPDNRLPGFYGGAVGFLGYDAVRYYEDLPDENADPAGQEDVYLILADELIVVDHIERSLRIVCNVRTDEFQDLDAAYDFAVQRLALLEKRLRGPQPEDKIEVKKGKMPIESNMSEQEFKDIVLRAREYIHAGDIFQVVLSKRFTFKPEVPAFQIYRGLRSINPSPYMYYLNLGPYRIVGSSPEILVRLEDGTVTLRPIAGTRRRGKTPELDKELEADLLSDKKEIAEHIMLVDLGRNDVGRVSEPGSVRVTEFKVIERYSHVMHIVSNCEGQLKQGTNPYNVLRASMPAGTLSGAPKIRAMEIIDELENVRRGIYGGSIGFFSYNGDFDVAIAIRTMIMQGEDCHLQAGAGVVFDSNPDMECMEVANKVRGMLAAVRFARRGLA